VTGPAGNPFGGGAALAQEVVGRLAEGRPLAGLDLGEVDGRIDLRGLPGSGPGEVAVRGAALAGLDLRGAHLPGWSFHVATVRDCRLDGADCRDWRLWDSTVERCLFDGADLRGAALGTWHDGRGNAWRAVDLRRADLRGSVCVAARLEDCDFSGARLTGVSFQQCTLLRCRFAGALNDVTFDGRSVPGRPAAATMQDVDLTGARFDQVDFLGSDLSGVALPADPDLRLVRRYPCTVERALADLDRVGADSPASRVLRAVLESRRHLLRSGSSEDDAAVLNRRDFLPFGGEELATLALDVLTRAEADCLSEGAPSSTPSSG
jgi:uncharacterized protein YjbI with pentapeptide repeats